MTVLLKSVFVTLLVCCAATASAQSLTLSLDAMVYEQGDQMEITIANPSQNDVEFIGDPPYCVHNINEYQCTSLPVITDFLAGSVMVVDYDTDDGVLEAGACEVTLTWQEDGQTYSISEQFTLTTSVDDDGVAWGTLKGRFR